jgi:arabinose-5-phosphate isomerase
LLTDKEILNKAKFTLEIESESLLRAKSFLADDFVNAVKTVVNAKGRLIITGIGKSANIAAKIVATLNSTGTPSVFMHAADAIHGAG